MSDPDKGRIAIKFGKSAAAGNTSRPKPSSSLGKRPRTHAFGGGSGSESDEDDGHGRHEDITGFGADGAETGRQKVSAKQDYVITKQPNRDWRSEVRAQRRGKNLLPPEARAQANGTTVETEPSDQDKGIKWGLTVKEKSTQDDLGPAAPPEEPTRTSSEDCGQEETPAERQRTADDEAMDALLGKAPKKEKVIAHPTEDDAYRRDVEAAGVAPTLEDYESMPVEEFGAALLRGMGWDGKPRGPKVKEVKRRQNRLGLGAKELKETEDLGAWGQNGKKKPRPRLSEYRREEEKRKEFRRRDDSYKDERERERGQDRHRDRDKDRDRDRGHHHRDRHRDGYRDYDRDRRR